MEVIKLAQPIEELSFLFPKQKPQQASVFATVKAVGSSELTVRIDGSEADASAVKGCAAVVGERVFCIITELGALVAVAKIYIGGVGEGWNGIIELDEEVELTQFTTRMYALSDSLETKLHIPEQVGLTEAVAIFSPSVSLYALSDTPPQIVGEYTLSYSGNGNSTGTVPPDQTGGQSYTVSGNDFGLARAGFSFDGWDTLPNGAGTRYQGGDTITITDDITLYAAWKVA